MSMTVRHIKPPIWYVLLAVLFVVCAPLALQRWWQVDTSIAVSVVQPLLALAAAWFTRIVTHGRRGHLRHQAEKSLIIGSVMSVWFVVYFASGLIVTYVHNVVAMNWLTVLQNILAFGTTAFAIEYIRQSIMLFGGRRDVMLLGTIVASIFALEQINITPLLELAGPAEAIKATVGNIMPAIVGSSLLTYLAFTAGFGPQLTYRFGVLAIMYLPPIIPKYDWYLTGIVWLLLGIAVYVTIDRTRRETTSHRRHYRHVHVASDIMYLVVMIALVMFMIGGFTYKPQAIMSNSMHPVFDRGAIVVVQRVDAMQVQIGDIVQYQVPGRSTTHRVIDIDHTSDGSGKRVFITKGDNSPSADVPVQANQIIGIVRAQVPYIGYPTVWLRELTGNR